MPRKRKRSALEEANLSQSSAIYRSKLRQLDCRKNDKWQMSDIANKSVPLESKKLPSQIFKQPNRSGRKKRKRSVFVDISRFLKEPKSKAVQTIEANSHEVITQLCGNANQNLSALDSSRDKELETKHENQIIETDIDLSRKEDSPRSETEIVSKNSTLECDEGNKSSINDVSTVHCRRDSVDQKLTQEDAIFSPEYSPIRVTEAKAWLETFRTEFDLSNSAADSNKLSEDVVDNANYIPTEKHRAISNDLGLSVRNSTADRINAKLPIGEKADEADLKIDIIQRRPQIESNTLENSDSSKKTLLFVTTSNNLLKERDEADCSSSSYSDKNFKKVDEKIDQVSCKAPEVNKFDIKKSLEEKKGCLRYAIPLEDISYKYDYHEFPIPILKPIQNYPLPAEFTLHVEKYIFIQNCPVVKCLSYQHRFPHSSPPNVWFFLCPTPSKIRLPNFVFISTASTPLPVLYNKKLYTFFENFMYIYSELKVGSNFILLNLLTDNESPISSAYPLQFSAEHDNIISTILFDKLRLKINKVRPTVIMETESIENCEYDHPCLFKKFGNFKFVSLNIMPDVISENSKRFSSERQVSVSIPFTVQKDSCSCMLVDRKVALACPLKVILLALTNSIQFIQSLTHIDSTARPLEGNRTCAPQKRTLSPKLDVHNTSEQFKSKKIKLTRLKKKKSKINVEESIALRSVERKNDLQTIGQSKPNVKRLNTQTGILFNKNILPLNFVKEKFSQHTAANPHKLKDSDGNMQVLSAAPREFSQSISPKAVAMPQLPEIGNLVAQTTTSLQSSKSKNIEHPLVSKSEIKLSTVKNAAERWRSQTLLRNTLREYYSQNKSVLSMDVGENQPLCLVKKPNTDNSSMEVASKHSAVMAIGNKKDVQSKSYFSFELKNLEGLNSETPSNTKSSNSNDIFEFHEDLPPSSQNSASPSSSNIVQNMSFTANNVQTSIKTVNTPTKSDQIGKKINAVTVELVNSKSLSCHPITLYKSVPFSDKTLHYRSKRLSRERYNFLGFMEVHFFEPIKGRNPNLRLSVTIPASINATALTVDKMHIYPNAILVQSVATEEQLSKSFLHVRKIISIGEIEGIIFDHKYTSAPTNGFDKQTFMFQLSQMKLPQREFEKLRTLNNSFIPKGMYLLTPVKKNGASEIELYKKLKNNQLSELKREIGIRYNLGKECVGVKDLLKIPNHLFFTSNIQLTDVL